MTTDTTSQPTAPVSPATIEHIAAGVDSRPEGIDAVVLAAAITEALNGDLVLASIEPELPLIVPGFDWRRTRRETEAMLARTREVFAPSARSAIDSDLSTARGLRRVLAKEHRQLIVCGSTRHGEPGRVTMGHIARQLLEHQPCALAIAPRRLSARGAFTISRVGVAYDAGPGAREAVAVAATIAEGCGARLIVRGVIDDRIPALGWPRLWVDPFRESWDEIMEEQATSLRHDAEAATAGLSVPVTVDIDRDVPAASLLDFSLAIDLLVIGSRRWGPMARLVLGGAGEALAHGSHCALLIVPRPESES